MTVETLKFVNDITIGDIVKYESGEYFIVDRIEKYENDEEFGTEIVVWVKPSPHAENGYGFTPNELEKVTEWCIS